VEHADGSTVTRCVAFDTDAISGEQLLTLSGIGWSSQSFGDFGDAACALDGEPARYAECPGKDRYWAVFVAQAGGSWQLANVGISTLVLHDGDAEGFRYVPASGVPAAPPSPAGVCAATPTVGIAAATASAGATVGATPRNETSAPTPSGGVDLGLLAAAVVGGGLAGLAILRVVARRRPGP
jgi:hypothetical protein